MTRNSRYVTGFVLAGWVLICCGPMILAGPTENRGVEIGEASQPPVESFRPAPASFGCGVEQAPAQPDPTDVEPVQFEVTFDVAIDPLSFTQSDIRQDGSSTVGNWGIVDSGDHQRFYLSARSVGDGTVIPSIPAGVVDDGNGNSNQASLSIDNSVTFGTFACNTLTYLYLGIWSPARIRIYCVESDGSLTFQSELDAPGDVRDMQFSASGRSLFYADANLTRYTVSIDGSLVPSRTRTVGYGSFDDLVLDPYGHYLYGSHSRGGGRVYVYDATRASMPEVQMVNGFYAPHGLAIEPSGQYLYVANYLPEEIYSYPLLGDGRLDEAHERITSWVPRPMYFAVHPSLNRLYWTETAGRDALAGSLSAGRVTRWDHETSGSGARAITIDKAGSFVYVANNNDDDISTFLLAPTGGLIPRWLASTARRPEHLLLHPGGGYLYVASAGDDGVGPSVISIYEVEPDGQLTPMAPVVIPDQGAYRLAIINLTAP